MTAKDKIKIVKFDIIGAKGEDNGGQCPIACNYGAAYIFRYNGNDWIEEAKLTASDRETLDQFGFSVSIDETVAVIGTYNSESAYVFRYDGTDWIQEAIIIPTAIEHVWDINTILDENGHIGSILKGLFGYNGNPSLIEVLSYFIYLVFVFVLWRNIERVHKVV